MASKSQKVGSKVAHHYYTRAPVGAQICTSMPYCTIRAFSKTNFKLYIPGSALTLYFGLKHMASHIACSSLAGMSTIITFTSCYLYWLVHVQIDI